MKDYFASIVGMLLPGGFSTYSLIEKLNPIFQFIGLLITISVGVTVLIINRKKISKLNRDKEIDEIILKHK